MPTDRIAVFLDRDGTLIEDAGYPRDPDLVRLLPGAVEALREFSRLGAMLVVVSNQSGVGRGLIAPEEAAAVADRFEGLLRAEGVVLGGSYHCFHAPHEGCGCRKPEPGMLLRAARDLGVDLGRSVIVGDRPSDVEAGRRACCATVLLCPDGEPRVTADFVARDWAEAVGWVARRLDAPRPAS